MRDALDRLRRRTLATWLAGAPAIALAAWWVLRAGDVTPRLPGIPAPVAPGAAAEAPPAPLDQRAFARRLTPEPPRVAEAPKPSAATSITLELVGIVRSEGHLVAALYDPAGDRVHLVKSGERVGTVEVRAVEERGVTLAVGAETRTLRLKKPEGAP